MPSPFPGMNPYLEQEDAWHDFHERFIPLVAATLGSQLRPRYIVMIAPQSASAPVTGLLEAPARVRLPAVDHERLSYVEILDRRNRELVTVVELLSPSNKQPGPDREQYVAKRMELLSGPVHLVEINLLRGGLPLLAAGRPGCFCSVLVSRDERRLDADFWPIMLRERLPVIPTPVRASPSRNAPIRPVRSIAQAKPLRSFAACRRSGRISS